MRRNGFQGLEFDISTATLSDYDQDQFLGIQPAGFAGDASGNAPFELHSPFGFLSRPRDPDAAGLGCQVLFAATGDDCLAWLSHDPRFLPLVPPLKKGGSVQYGATGTFDLIDGENGSKTLYVPYAFASNGKPAKAMAILIDVSTAGQESIGIVHGDGMGIAMNGADGSITIRGKDGAGFLSIAADGTITHGGPVNFASGLTTGALAPGALPVALAVPLATWMGLVTAALAAIAAKLAPATPVVGDPATAATIGLATAATPAAVAAMTAKNFMVA